MTRRPRRAAVCRTPAQTLASWRCGGAVERDGAARGGAGRRGASQTACCLNPAGPPLRGRCRRCRGRGRVLGVFLELGSYRTWSRTCPLIALTVGSKTARFLEHATRRARLVGWVFAPASSPARENREDLFDVALVRDVGGGLPACRG